jgi:hypothetical protein
VPISAFCTVFPQITHVKFTDTFLFHNAFSGYCFKEQTVEVILVPLVILGRLLPSKWQGSLEREITNMSTGNSFGLNRTNTISIIYLSEIA